MRHPAPHPPLAALLRRILGLLERLQPEEADGYVRWLGPFFIPRPGQWWPTHFMLYRSELYSTVEIGWSSVTLIWTVDTDEVAFEGEVHFGVRYWNGPELWADVLTQVEHRLRGAVGNPAAYNRRVARLLPIGCRTGHIRRKWTWPRRSRRPLSPRDRVRLERALERGKQAPSWPSLSVRQYLEVAALGYDAAFAELRGLTPFAKHQKMADGRHGGMLDLRPEDAGAFESWYSARTWHGTHPWEIVFAHPHGVLLSPHREGDAWRFFLIVDNLGLYQETARMAIALGEGDVPFELYRAPEVIAALRGEDTVKVGPFYGQIDLEELESRRPGAAARVRWEPPPVLVFREPRQSR